MLYNSDVDDELKNIIKAVFETRYLKRVERSGTALLLGNQLRESIPEHSFYVALFGIVMQHLNPKLNLGKLLTMCIVHDLEEVRTADLNQVNKLYHKQDVEMKAFVDMWQGSKLGNVMIKIHTERHNFKSPEAIASQDCDSLAELILEKEYLNMGYKEASEWMTFTIQRLRTNEGKKIAKAIQNMRLTMWWENIKNEIRVKHGIKPLTYK